MSIRKAIISLPETLTNVGDVVRSTYKIPLYMRKIRSVYFYSTNKSYLSASATTTGFNVNLKMSLNNFQTTPINKDFALGYNDDDDYTRRDAIINHKTKAGQILHYIAEYIHNGVSKSVGGGKICIIYEYENPNKKN